MDLVPKINNLWSNEITRDSLVSNASELTRRLKNINKSNKISGVVSDDVFEDTFNLFKSNFDKDLGGFGNSPKFPKFPQIHQIRE